MSLYQKYRPKTFEDMQDGGQIKALNVLLQKKDHPHVYLFIGDSGCGKTTAARISADIVNAEIWEINSADDRGIETAREIIDVIKGKPISGKNIAFIIDEAHRCTVDFFNAMLKPLEDTPDYVYFFICTTDPQKIIKTFLNRCTKFEFNSLSDRKIERILQKIIELENMKINEEIIESIIDNSNGCPRNAIQLLEKIIGLDERKALKIIQNGIEDNIDIKNICQGILKNDMSWKECTDILKKLDNDPEEIRRSIIGYMSAVLLSGKQNDCAAQTIYELREPLYNIGKVGLVLGLYQIFFPEK